MQSKNSQRLSLVINIIIPMLILTKLSGEQYLGTTRGLIVALAFPLGYGLFELYTQKSRSFVSGLGLFSVLMTGGIGLLQLPTHRVAIKEALVPAVIGTVLIISLWTKHNLIETMFLHILDIELITTRLKEQANIHIRTDGMRTMTYRIIASFVLSTVLNYVLAKRIVVSPAGTEAFNEEIGTMTGLSFPIIALPSTIILTGALMWFLMKLHKETGLEIEDMIKKTT